MDATAAAVEFYIAVDQGEERVVVSLAYAFARLKNSAQLANNDVAGPNILSAESFYAATLAVGIAAVSAGTLAFFMCHDIAFRVRGSGFRTRIED